MATLRKKLQPDKNGVQYIQTHIGIGYRMLRINKEALQVKRSIAQYHLPGLFEFYELYKVFLPLFREHREYFYDWCDIGSVYSAPADCI